jgi:hypothetical protein
MAKMLVTFTSSLPPSIKRRNSRIAEPWDSISPKKENNKKGCTTFTDLQQAPTDLQPYLIQACELGLMGYYADGQTTQPTFNPNAPITVAELTTAVSRLLWGEYFKGSEKWRYHNHLLAIQKANLIPANFNPTQSVTKKDAQSIFSQLSTLKNAS